VEFNFIIKNTEWVSSFNMPELGTVQLAPPMAPTDDIYEALPVALRPEELKSPHVVPEPGYDLVLVESKNKTRPSVTTLFLEFEIHPALLEDKTTVIRLSYQ
jgi:hypothetical protein